MEHPEDVGDRTTLAVLIPIGVLPLDRAYLRVTAPLNGQRERIRYAKDCEIARVDCVATDGRSAVLRTDLREGSGEA